MWLGMWVWRVWNGPFSCTQSLEAQQQRSCPTDWQGQVTSLIIYLHFPPRGGLWCCAVGPSAPGSVWLCYSQRCSKAMESPRVWDTRGAGSVPAPAAPWPGRGDQGRGWGSTEGQTLQETHLTGSQDSLHHCLSLSIPSCLLTPAQLTWHSGKPNLIFQLKEPSDLHRFQTDFIKESGMPSCQLEETQTFAKLWLRNREEKEHRSNPGYSMCIWPGMWVAQDAAPPAWQAWGGVHPCPKCRVHQSDANISLLRSWGQSGELWWKAGVAQALGIQERWTNKVKRPLK